MANLISWPIAWILMNNWLNQFAYRINVGLLIFVGAGLITLIIALFTIFYHAAKSALANPIDSLKYE